MKTWIIFPSAIALAVFLISSGAYAHHASAGSGIGQAGPVITVSASTLKKGTFSIEVLAEFQRFDTYSDSELLDFAESGIEDVHNAEYLFSPSTGIAYGLTDDLTLHVRVPYVARNNISAVHHHEEEDEYEIEQFGDARGWGDITLFSHYRFLNRSDMQASLLAGLKMPTGKKSARTGSGELFEAEFQPGSGSWDAMAGIALTKPLGAFSLDANILYTLASEGVQDTDLGDVFNYNVSVGYRALKQPLTLDLILEANGTWRQKEKVKGQKSENSGGDIVLISPGVRAGINDRIMIYFNIGLPLIQDLNGKQNDMDYRTVLGMNVLL